MDTIFETTNDQPLEVADAELRLSGTTVRLRPLIEDDAGALAATGLPVEVGDDPVRSAATYIEVARTGAGGRRALAVEWYGLVWRRGESAPRCEWLFVGTTSLFAPAPGAGERDWRIGATWIAPSVCRSRCLAECRLLLLTHAFVERAATRVVVGSAEAGSLGVVDRGEWPVTRRLLRAQLAAPVRRADSSR